MTITLLRTVFLFLYGILPTFLIAQDTPLQATYPADTGRTDTLIKIADAQHEALLPVSIIRGKQQGPVFTIVAGIHGYEYPPIIAVQRILAELRPEALNGTLVIIPIANTPAFFGRAVFLNPQDKKNLNRVFPGDPQGSVTERIADYIARHIIPGSDVFLDIHAGDAGEDLLPFVCYYDKKDSPEQLALAEKLTTAAGFRYNVVYPYTITATEPAQYAFKHATQQGVTALSIEAGKLGNVQKDAVMLIRESIYNMLDEMDMYAAPSATDPGEQLWITGQHYVKSPEQGIFYSDLKSGDHVAKGQPLGYITDVFGKDRKEIRSPADGIILYKTGTPPVNTGETLYCIGTP
ncbi:hypothetical protein SAMN02927921_00394 [Sinomicrobium oceani]|uniref:Succinylglutamate desuccinylase/Aspartoacylase catalytic domain-containing protein n=1 Tax=Sinomicrobium oceani TaxID=1150368 RepID=A0A1K1M5L6_9FLAO|nr:succinylglutamate desuccinylase/aspartoacylase family protein [Sinomicrobium oceani]SFW18369.1 hypothetical protein SAMN02927921_00394 [Sinomicrobium oceani]